MEGQGSMITDRRRYGKQPISVPFLWEEKPGVPKKGWTITRTDPFVGSPLLFVASPARLIISVPFQWEEMPGKPLWSDPIPESLSPPLLPLNPFVDEFQETASEDGGSSHHEDWYSVSGTECHSSSSDTVTRNGSSSIDDASALEFPFPFSSPDSGIVVEPGLKLLFPLASPRSGFLNKVCRQESSVPGVCLKMPPNKSWGEELTARRQLTLGELILLSRKLSYLRKPDVMKNKKFSMVSVRKNLFAFFAIRTNCVKNNVSIASN